MPPMLPSPTACTHGTSYALRLTRLLPRPTFPRRFLSSLLFSAFMLAALTTMLPAQGYRMKVQLVEGFGQTYQSRLGYSVLGLGDINGDGWPDIGVHEEGTARQLHIYYGGPGILDSLPDLNLPGGRNALMVDLNGDGYKDLCTIQAASHLGAIPSRDTLFVFLGRPGPGLRIDTVPAMHFVRQPPSSGLDFGFYMARGDLNGDGIADLVVSARDDHVPGVPGDGSVFVFLGRPQLDSIPDFIGKDTRPYRIYYGQGMQVGDVNGDGIDDLVVGERYYGPDSSGSLIDKSVVNLYLGARNWVYRPEAPDQVLEADMYGFPLNHSYSFCVGSLFDTNEDGRADYFVGMVTPQGVNVGLIIYGTPTGFSRTATRQVTNPVKGFAFQEGARRIGDINGDGYRDYAVPMGYGDMYVYYHLGTPSGMEDRPRVYSSNYADDYGAGCPPRVDNAGDVNGDGVDDILVSSSTEMTDIRFGYFHVVSGMKSGLYDADDPPARPATLAVGSAWPNPMHAACAFDVALSTPGTVHVSVHDVLGRTIRAYDTGDLPPGRHTLHWDGRTSDGQPALPGVYWYHVAAAETYGTGRVVLQ